MARIIFGNIVAEARGKIGGVVYSRNTGGAYARQKVSPVQPRTNAQLNQRGRLAELSKAWQELTQSQREAWKSFSLEARKRDVLGLSKQRSAQQMYMFCNLALSSVGLDTIDNPPTSLLVDALTSCALVNGTSGAVQSVTVGTAGSGYTSPPTVSFTGGSGSGAAATSFLQGTSLGSISVAAGGSGYTSPPTVTLVGGGGSGATATATIVSGAITAFTVTNAGSGYTTLPTVLVAGGGGSGGAGTAVLTATGVGGVTVTVSGTGYVSAPTVSFTGGGGAYAVATASLVQATSDLTLSFAPEALPQSYEFLEVWMTPAYSAGRTFVRSYYRYVALLYYDDPSPQDVTEAWTSVFGALPVVTPFKISVRCRIINSLNGARSEWATATLLQH
jgi:hypothetical protein